MSDDRFEAWLEALEKRHVADLGIRELRRAIQALSSLYVERRDRLSAGRALDGAGKRAAFALFYAPLHFLFVREVVRALPATSPAPRRVFDLGCGTGASGAAWALETLPVPELVGYDLHPWALAETRWTYRTLGLRGRVRSGDLTRARMPGSGEAALAAFTVNEIEVTARAVLLKHLLQAAGRGAGLLVVEPIAGRASPWWSWWVGEFSRCGGREETWRFAVTLPETLQRLDRATGLDHSELTGRTVWVPPRARPG